MQQIPKLLETERPWLRSNHTSKKYINVFKFVKDSDDKVFIFTASVYNIHAAAVVCPRAREASRELWWSGSR